MVWVGKDPRIKIEPALSQAGPPPSGTVRRNTAQNRQPAL